MLRHGWMGNLPFHINVCSLAVCLAFREKSVRTSSSPYTLLAGASPHLALLKKASESWWLGRMHKGKGREKCRTWWILNRGQCSIMGPIMHACLIRKIFALHGLCWCSHLLCIICKFLWCYHLVVSALFSWSRRAQISRHISPCLSSSFQTSYHLCLWRHFYGPLPALAKPAFSDELPNKASSSCK
jgi:hypothetical protein